MGKIYGLRDLGLNKDSGKSPNKFKTANGLVRLYLIAVWSLLEIKAHSQLNPLL